MFEIEKTTPTALYPFKNWYNIVVGLLFSISNVFINKISQANKLSVV